jgi:cystathionine beta-synthase
VGRADDIAAAMNQSPLPKPFGSVLDLIGSTPMVELKHFDTGVCRLFTKLESQNPGGSIKDRIALSMIAAAEQDGVLKPGGTIIEATAGNTGLALALVGVLKGYRIILVVPDKMAREKVQHLRALGADVRIARSDVGKGHPEYYQDLAERIARETRAYYVNQFGNPNNPLAHYRTTAPEIWEQMIGDVDAIVVGVGSGGTLSGIGRYFAEKSPKTRMILADPVGSVLAHYVKTGEMIEAGSWNVEGIGEDFIPDNADLALIKDAFYVSDRDSMDAARELLIREGILAGSSSGTLLSAALRFCRQQTEPLRVVTFVCDTGAKYLSKVYSDHWLAEQGLADRPIHGDLRDLVPRTLSEGGVVSISPSDTVLSAYNRMRQADVSQLPVIENGHLVGILDESDILKGVENEELAREARFNQPVRSLMTTNLRTLQVNERIDSLLPIFEREEVALIMDGTEFVGVITRVDLINHLRLHPKAS